MRSEQKRREELIKDADSITVHIPGTSKLLGVTRLIGVTP
jgi:hypothetical protein